MTLNLSNSSILNEARDYLDGLMLSDGHIENSHKTGRYSQHCKHIGWLNRVSNDLYEYGIESINITKQHIKSNFSPEGGSVNYMLRTSFYVEFIVLKNLWY